jgi:hypothetical protein
MATLLLVQGDTRAQIQTTITRSDTGSVVNLTTASSISLKFRKTYTTATLLTLTGVQNTAGDYAKGIATFEFSDTDLNVDAGEYEGEIEIVYSSDSTRETVFELVNFIVREDFA